MKRGRDESDEEEEEQEEDEEERQFGEIEGVIGRASSTLRESVGSRVRSSTSINSITCMPPQLTIMKYDTWQANAYLIHFTLYNGECKKNRRLNKRSKASYEEEEAVLQEDDIEDADEEEGGGGQEEEEEEERPRAFHQPVRTGRPSGRSSSRGTAGRKSSSSRSSKALPALSEDEEEEEVEDFDDEDNKGKARAASSSASSKKVSRGGRYTWSLSSMSVNVTNMCVSCCSDVAVNSGARQPSPGMRKEKRKMMTTTRRTGEVWPHIPRAITAYSVRWAHPSRAETRRGALRRGPRRALSQGILTMDI